MTVDALRPGGSSADWVDELSRAVVGADVLSAAARIALVATVDAFAVEDGAMSSPVEGARSLLAATLES